MNNEQFEKDLTNLVARALGVEVEHPMSAFAQEMMQIKKTFVDAGFDEYQAQWYTDQLFNHALTVSAKRA
ncbi:hypothetical protein [Nonomuraea gerenzanensis]|uniref:Uncharacterized protein n=1 Tax=Nonomuraea gerenzanensis TaxID=93944 RepID=A0A1M4DVK2_9ACTN|nr:hypothetical protein [Nonomuraea gerenzanensis]UBU12953.1 hypothetical protein LCN96_53380 [Nonomuraea gerenzanensis]SBO90592.1 hypothetical protein BN4615_P106 [Nonomuraea gerenzanensis]